MSNPFPPKNHVIPAAQAADMTRRYRENRKRILAEGMPENLLPICETFSKESIAKLLATTGAVSFRIYYGMDEKLNIHAILAAADEEGKDILPAAATLTGEGETLEDSYRCPDYCPPPSELNS